MTTTTAATFYDISPCGGLGGKLYDEKAPDNYRIATVNIWAWDIVDGFQPVYRNDAGDQRNGAPIGHDTGGDPSGSFSLRNSASLRSALQHHREPFLQSVPGSMPIWALTGSSCGPRMD